MDLSKSQELEDLENNKASGGSHEQCSIFGSRVAQWFDDRKITTNGNFNGQRHKLNEELSELDKSIHFGDNRVVDMDEFKDGIGDAAVVLAGMAHMAGLTFEECLEHAWNEIKNRTGHLNEDGIFVKDE